MVDARVLGRLDKWNGNREAWANWSFVMKAHDRAVNQQVSEEVKISADVVSNVQLGCVQLHLVLIMSCAGGDWDRIANAPRGWSAKAWRLLFQAFSPKNDARLGDMMMVVLEVLLDTVVAEAVMKSSLEGVSTGSGRSEDSELVC